MSRKLSIEEMQQIASGRGGKCLSKVYVNNKTNLLWECGQGHQWEAVPNNIKRGDWCAACAGNARLSIEEMQEIAVARGGKCLSYTYTNAKTKLLWGCSEGHQWKAVPDSVKNRGLWCPICRGKKTLKIPQ